MRAKQGLAAEVVSFRLELEGCIAALGPVARQIGPARQDARQLGHVLLRVAAVHAQGVQLHHLARVVLVEPALAVAETVSARHRALPVVEVIKHRRVLRRGAEQVAEAPQRIWPDRVALVGRQPDALLQPLAAEHVEMVEPEIGHHLLQLRRAVHRAQQPRLHRLLGDMVRRLLHFLARRRVVARLTPRRRPIAPEQFRRAETGGLQRIQLLLQLGRLGDLLRRQLLIDVAPGAHRRHPVEVAGAGPIREPVEHMQGLLPIRQTVRGHRPGADQQQDQDSAARDYPHGARRSLDR